MRSSRAKRAWRARPGTQRQATPQALESSTGLSAGSRIAAHGVRGFREDRPGIDARAIPLPSCRRRPAPTQGSRRVFSSVIPGEASLASKTRDPAQVAPQARESSTYLPLGPRIAALGARGFRDDRPARYRICHPGRSEPSERDPGSSASGAAGTLESSTGLSAGSRIAAHGVRGFRDDRAAERNSRARPSPRTAEWPAKANRPPNGLLRGR